jgi:hypothetical protein
MRTRRSNPLHASRLRPLAACLAIAFSATTFADPRGDHSTQLPDSVQKWDRALDTQDSSDQPATPQIWLVQNCSDHDPNSLRDIIENPNNAKSGDTVDLSQLPALCGAVSSEITLTTGEIAVVQDSLTLQGPVAADGSVTISGDSQFQVFNHTGIGGTFALSGLTISDGYNITVGKTYGGCIGSNGSVFISSVVVTNCTAFSNTQYALGGGIWAHDGVTLIQSTVSGNHAIAPAKRGLGGGIYTANLLSKYSSIDLNVAYDGVGGGFGGGIYATNQIAIYSSLIDDNIAAVGGGLRSHGQTKISNSTFSGNFAKLDFAAINVANDYLAIANSTIAFNHADSSFPGSGGAIGFNGTTSNGILELHSSIVANNTETDQGTPADLFILSGYGGLTGSDNLVIATNVVSPPPGVITVTADPRLGPLRFNGGPTKTHALLSDSPALTVGNDNAGFAVDQRGAGYPRTTGAAAKVDIGAFEFDSIFASNFDG